jgi:hypothetical protein
MAKTQIKHRYTDAVLFECNVPDTVSSGLAMRHALEQAVLSGAGLSGADLRYADLSGADLRDADLRYADLGGTDLRDANLSGANLRDADLRCADLRCANLSDADLRDADLRDAMSGANLSGADLRYANLRYANLRDADLRDANLSGADLNGADLSGADLHSGKAIGHRPYFSIGPIGSRADYLTLWLTDKGQFVKAGCFTGTLDEFAASVEKTHGENDHGKEYQMAILLMKSHAVLWTPKVLAKP